MNNKAEKLINELFDNPKKFNDNEFNGYELLEEFQKGLDLEILISILKNQDYNIFRLGISIASELNSRQCSDIISYLVPLVEIEKDKLYRYYLFEAIHKGSYDSKHNNFISIVNIIDSMDIEDIDSAMHFISLANDNQLQISYNYYINIKNETISKCLYDLLNYNSLDLVSIQNLIRSNNLVEQIFGVIIAKKVNNKYPKIIDKCLLSSFENVRRFAQNAIEDIEFDKDL